MRVVRQANAGKPAALNTGIRHARGDLLVLVDGDTVFEPDAVGRLVQPLRRPDGRRGVSGNTKVANRRGLLGRWQHLEYVIGFNLDRRMFDVARVHADRPRRDRRVPPRGAAATSAASPADTLAEDTDLTMAVLRAGWRVVYEPSARSPGPRRRRRCGSCGGSATAGATARCRRCGSTAGRCASAGRRAGWAGAAWPT